MPSACLALLAIAGFSYTAVSADGQPDTKLRISPLERRVSVDPDGVYAGDATGPFVLRVANEGDSAMTVTMAARPYSIMNKTYDKYSFEQETEHTQLARWISFDKTEYEIQPGETIDVPFTITVPDDVPSGGQYAIVSAATKIAPQKVGGQVLEAVSELGMVVYGRVSGETREEAKVQSMEIKSFQAPQYNSEGANQSPLGSLTTVKNSGNVDFSVKTSLTVNGVFSGKEVAAVKNQDSVVLPGTEREIVTQWADSPLVGIYKVTSATEVLGKSYQTSQIVVIFPPVMAAISLIVLVVLVVGVVLLIKIRGGKKSGGSKLQRSRGGKVKLQPKENI